MTTLENIVRLDLNGSHAEAFAELRAYRNDPETPVDQVIALEPYQKRLEWSAVADEGWFAKQKFGLLDKLRGRLVEEKVKA